MAPKEENLPKYLFLLQTISLSVVVENQTAPYPALGAVFGTDFNEVQPAFPWYIRLALGWNPGW